MKKLLKRSAGLAAVASVLAPAAALAAPVQVNSFSISPACTHPGGTVNATVTVEDTTWFPQSFYAQESVDYFGYTVQNSGASGSYPAFPAVPETQSVSQTIPQYAPWGTYTVHLGIGPSATDASSWSTSSATFQVWPWC
jgi:hypothetical protein